jgi:hypothetical protein
VNGNKYDEKYENTDIKLGEGTYAKVYKMKSIQNPNK